MEERKFAGAGSRVVIEEFIEGEEASIFAITDGRTILILEPVQDHKQVGDGDSGPNTGGMGAYSPVGSLGRRVLRQIEQRILVPTIHALAREDIEFRGVLFCGLMITEAGPKVLEFNTRFGDPECQSLMRRFKPDLYPYLLATAEGRLEDMDPPTWDERSCVSVVACSEGYPGSFQTGDTITGLRAADEVEDTVVFHAGTGFDGPTTVTAGGRVLCVTSLAPDLDGARELAYSALDRIDWNGKFFRRDIGCRHEHARPRTEREIEDAIGSELD